MTNKTSLDTALRDLATFYTAAAGKRVELDPLYKAIGDLCEVHGHLIGMLMQRSASGCFPREEGAEIAHRVAFIVHQRTHLGMVREFRSQRLAAAEKTKGGDDGKAPPSEDA